MKSCSSLRLRPEEAAGPHEPRSGFTLWKVKSRYSDPQERGGLWIRKSCWITDVSV